MFYYFDIDKEAPTGANQRRKKLFRKAWKGSLFFLSILLLVVSLFALYVRVYQKRQNEAYQIYLKKDTIAGTILSLPEHLPGYVTYEFVPRGQDAYYSGSYYILEQTEEEQHFLRTHQVGDSCKLRYRVLKPQFNSLIVE